MKQLSPDMVRLLSSSQVITSVVNVVKELMENSLDAAATSIDVKLENYGLDRIEVRDNGLGIKAADTPVMAVRHFTSKICSHEDLEHLETYGFRGEALGSVCAVAEVAVITKTEEDDISTQYMLDLNGNIVSQRPSHLGQGTTVSVLKLFKNLHVRRQYYSSTMKCKDELKKVQDLLVAYAIIKPELRLMLVHNKVVVWQKTKVADHRSALIATLGPGVACNLLHCQHCHEQPEVCFFLMIRGRILEELSFIYHLRSELVEPTLFLLDRGKIVLEGFFPKPGADYASTSSLSSDKTFIFINNRPVQHKEIIKLLRQHYTAQYSEDSARKRYPTLMMKITVSPSSVDVNLTPDKTQVLLQNTGDVLTAVEALVISLYGFRPSIELTTNKELSHETLQTSDGLLQTDDPLTGTRSVSRAISPRNHSNDNWKTVSKHSDTGLSVDVFKPCVDRQNSNPSSSSSVADDWFVNPIPVESNFLDSTGIEKASSSRPQESLRHCEISPAETSKEQMSVEDWSRGTALKDPVSCQPLLPVEIHQPLLHNDLKGDEIKSPSSSSGKKMVSAITEKLSLTAYDLISNRTARAPLGPAALFQKESRAEVLREKPTASLQDINIAVHQRWKNLGEEERKKYEEKAKKHLELYDQKAKLASAQDPSTPRNPVPGQKRKGLLSNQQLLDQLFSAQPQKKMKSPPPKPCQFLPCSTAALRLQLQRLSSQNNAAPRGLHLVNRLASQSAWVILCGQRLMLLNPFRVEEALLFKRLLENNILPAVSLQSPIQLTDGNLGGAEYTKALCNMEKQNPELNRSVFFSDRRLVANGFKVKLTPGHMSVERHLEVTAMADCIPFLGLEDLREILTAVLHRKAKTVQECRPLKVTNYLQGEAVRLVRQLPTNVSMEDVKETVLRMEQQLGDTSRTCIHGRPFLQHLCDIPSTEQEALSLLKPLEL